MRKALDKLLELKNNEEDFQRLVEARYRFLADQGMEIEERVAEGKKEIEKNEGQKHAYR